MGRVAFFSIVLAVASATHDSGPFFYVSSSRGSDANAGTSAAAPFATPERAAAAVAGVDGATVLLRGGDAWLGRGAAWFIANASDLTIAAYADATSGAERPLIARDPANAAGPTLTLDAAPGAVVTGLAIRGGENGIALTYHLAGGAAATYAGPTIADCLFDGIHGLHYNASTGSWWGAAIALAAANAGVTVTNVSVTNCIFNSSDTAYINALPYPGWTRAYIDGLEFVGNALVGVEFNSVFLDTTRRVGVRRSVFYHDTPAALFVAGTTDIIIGTLDASNAIEGNEIASRGEYSPGGPDGCAIDFETSAHGMSVVGNYISHSFGAGIMVFGHETTSTDLVIAGNTMLYNGCNQTRDDHGGIAFMHLNSSGTVSGNTFATCAGTPLFFPRIPHALDGWTFADNAVDGGNTTLAVAAAPSLTLARDGAGRAVLTATAAAAGDALRYTTDGSRPTRDAPLWPGGSGGALTLPPRAAAVFVKAFPADAPPPPPGTLRVESGVVGGVFAPAAA